MILFFHSERTVAPACPTGRVVRNQLRVDSRSVPFMDDALQGADRAGSIAPSGAHLAQAGGDLCSAWIIAGEQRCWWPRLNVRDTHAGITASEF
jgi:hypothetical protein